MKEVFDIIKELGGFAGFIVVATGIWQCWYASQFNEIEVLIAGNNWRRRRDLGISSFIFMVLLMSNCAMGISMNMATVYLFFGFAVLCWLIGVVFMIIYKFKKNTKLAHVINGTLFGSIIFVVWIVAYFAFINFVSDGNGGYKTDNIFTYIAIVALATVIECLCFLVLLRTISRKSRVLLKLRQYDSKDKELFVYRRIGDDLICGTDADIYSSKDIIIVPTEDVKTKGYSYGFSNTDSDDSEKQKQARTIINIEADNVIVTKSEKSSDEKEDSEA